MKSETSLVASHYRLRKWTAQIQACNNRPEGMEVQEWLAQHNISKAAYYYRLKKVREACLDLTDAPQTPTFVEVPLENPVSCNEETSAIIRMSNGVELQIRNNASESFLRNLIGAIAHVE